MSTRSKRASTSNSGAQTTRPAGGIRPLPGRKPLSDRRRVTMLVLGDALVFLVFATIGLQSHHELIASILQIVLVALPFAVAWFLIAPWLGVYKKGLELDPRAMFRRTLIAWAIVWPVGMILRGIFFDHGIPPLAFWIVALISIAIILLVWRVPFAVTHQMNARGQ